MYTSMDNEKKNIQVYKNIILNYMKKYNIIINNTIRNNSFK